MSYPDVRSTILEALEAAAGEHGADIVDVDIEGAGKSTVIRVRIDRAEESDEPISLDEVAAQTPWINAIIDELDPIATSYMLEVSSPGMARPLRKARDFERFAGSTVRLETTATEGRRRFTGTLEGIDEGSVALTVDGQSLAFSLDEIKSCTIKPEYDFSGKAGNAK